MRSAPLHWRSRSTPILADDARERLVEVRTWKVAKDSTEIAQQLLDSRRKTLGERHPKTGKAQLLLSYVQGHSAAAEKNALEGRNIIEAAYGRNHPEYAYALVADSWAYTSNIREGIAEEREALRIDEQTLGLRHVVTMNTRAHLGGTILFRIPDADRRPEDTQEAFALLHQALEEKRAAGIPAPFEKQHLGYGLLLFGPDADLPQAEAWLREARREGIEYFADSDVHSIQMTLIWNKLRYREGYRDEADRGFADWLAANQDYMQAAAAAPNLNRDSRNTSLYDALAYRALYAFETCRKSDAEHFLSQLIEFNGRVKKTDDKLTRGYLENLRKGNSLAFPGLIISPSESAAINARAKKCSY